MKNVITFGKLIVLEETFEPLPTINKYFFHERSSFMNFVKIDCLEIL